MTHLAITETIAGLIGQYALTFITLVTVLVLLGMVVSWQLFNQYYGQLWQTGYSVWERLSASAIAHKLWQTSPRFWGFLGRRLSPDSYLGLHLTVGFIISFITFVMFGNLAEQVVEAEGVVRFDQELANALYQNANALEITLFHLITNLGGRMATIVIGLGVALWLLLRQHKLLLISWAVAIIGNSVLNFVLKFAFQRARPTFDNPLLVESFYSFPSGHAMGSVVMYGMLAYILSVLVADLRWKRMALACITIWFILFIGFSRMYLGVHYFSDIAAGYAAGLGWLTIVITGTEVARRRSSGKLRQAESLEANQPHPTQTT